MDGKLSLFFLCICIMSGYAHSVEEHVLGRIDQSVIIETPFPALVIDHFFPDDFYEEAIRQFPAFDSSRSSGNRSGLPISPTKKYFSKYTEEQQAFWGDFNELMNIVIKPALVKKFGHRFLKKFELEKYSNHSAYIENNFLAYCDSKTDVLCLDRRGYGIDTHVDQLPVYLKVLVYFPEDDSMASYGTYMIDCNKRASHGASYLEKGDKVNGEYLIEYQPNRLVVMMQTPISWHRVQFHDFSALRRTYNGSIYVDFDFFKSIDDDPSIAHKAESNDYRSKNPVDL